MRKKEFSRHLEQLTPQLKKQINIARKNKYFGWLDAKDLLQEVLLHLFLQVPKHYKKEKGSFKNYCMVAAKNRLKRLATEQYNHYKEIQVDWSGVCEHSHGESDQDDTTANVYALASKKIRIEQDTKRILFKAKLDELAKLDKDFQIISTIYRHDANRHSACKELKLSNASITKVYKRIRRYRTNLTITTNPVAEYIKNGVNVFSRDGISYNMKQTQPKLIKA